MTNLLEFVFLYLLGALIVSNIITVWMLTNIPTYLSNFLFRTSFLTRDEWEDHVIIHKGKIGELMVCPLCLSTHLSWIVYFVFFYFVELPILGFIPCSLSWPLLSYVLYINVKS